MPPPQHVCWGSNLKNQKTVNTDSKDLIKKTKKHGFRGFNLKYPRNMDSEDLI